MSQTFFSKQDALEKNSRLELLGNSRANVTIWVKGQPQKHLLQVLSYDKGRNELVLDAKENLYPKGTSLLCSFELRGMTFFLQTQLDRSMIEHNILKCSGDLFKSERRTSYRLLTYPIYDVWVDFDLGEVYEGGKVVDLKSRSNQTELFKSFLQLVDDQENSPAATQRLKVRVQDLSTTGLSLHIGEIDLKYFTKGVEFKNVNLSFIGDVIQVPTAKVVYLMDYIGADSKLKKYKVGIHFEDLPLKLDDQLGKKINSLLREVDSNKDFETFLK